MATKLRLLLCALAAVTLAAAASAWALLSPVGSGDDDVVVEVRPATSVSDIRRQMKGGLGFNLACRIFSFSQPRTGRYVFSASTSWLECVHMLRGHAQTPVRLVLPSVRTMADLSGFLSRHLMMDSAAVAGALSRPSLLDSLGFTTETVPALFIPNTYELWWDTTPESFLLRMRREHDAFWTEERRRLAERQGLTPVEIATLASILDEETANNAEKPAVAGMYLNRLRRDMLLQADPTVKFALGDFSLRRIRHGHLEVESPYNTYRVKGLPPGPIRIASTSSIDAVLHAAEHPYLYMCANADFSGTHVFAATYAEHLANARRYQQALNARGVN
jgi:UPF0755 protein